MKKQKFMTGGKKFFISLFVSLTVFSLIAAVSAISRGYSTDDDSLKPGMAVKLSDTAKDETGKVERANIEDADKFIGITTRVKESPVTIASKGQSVFVESEGEVATYISDLKGPVKQGDKLTISPLRGILAKADPNSSFIAGVAAEDFSYAGADTYEIKSSNGSKFTSINKVRVNLDTAHGSGSNNVDSSIERLGRAITGKDISEIRVVVTLVIFLLVLYAEGGILYGAISSGVIAVGRNPLAKGVILKELMQIFGVAILVLLIGLGAIYLVLLA